MTENLSPEKRLGRIAQIINKGIYLLALKEGWFADSVKQKIKTTKNEALSFEERQIIDLCRSKGRITNKDFQDLIGVHRNTATKRLKEIALKGLLLQQGNYRHTCYVLNVHRAEMCIEMGFKKPSQMLKNSPFNVHR